MYNRLQTRLNPVPESLNSPDIAPPSSSGLGRARDDPVRVYNRDLAISSSTVSTSSSSRSADPALAILAPKQQQHQQQQQLKSQNGYNSSSSEGESPRATAQTTKTTTTTTTMSSSSKTVRQKLLQHPIVSATTTVMSKVDTGLHQSVGKLRPSSASRSMSLGRKISPANKQVNC